MALFSLLVIVLTPVNDLADRRIGIGRYFDQIQTSFFRKLQGLLFCQDTELFTVFVDNSQLRRPNLVIQAGMFGDFLVSITIRLLISA